jgi:hypothetical protein
MIDGCTLGYGEPREIDTVKRVKQMTARGNSRYVLLGHTHFYAQVTMVLQLPKDGKRIWGTLGDEFFLFLKKTWMRKGYEEL